MAMAFTSITPHKSGRRSLLCVFITFLLIFKKDALANAFLVSPWRLLPSFVATAEQKGPLRQGRSQSLSALPPSKVPKRLKTSLNESSSSSKNKKHFSVALNDFFRDPVPEAIKSKVSIRLMKEEDFTEQRDLDVISLITAPPTVPGTPRPLWLVILASVPTGLLWYGYYKFCIEEELLQIELDSGKSPRGFGGYGTLGPFTYRLILGTIAEILHLPGGSTWSALAIIYIYYTQFLLYDRVNELYKEEGSLNEPPLTIWWCWPIFFPFNLIVGLRQVHFLSQYFYRKRGIDPPPVDPVVEFFPFIEADKFTWQEFLTTPRLWCSLLKDAGDVDRKELMEPVQDFLKLGE